MGIRHHAVAVRPECLHIERQLFDLNRHLDALASGCPASDDWYDHLSLDKAWCLLGRVLHPGIDLPPRPAHRLVESHITYPWGYAAPYISSSTFLEPAELFDAWEDLMTVTEQDVRRELDGVRPDDVDYVLHHLAAAKEYFTRLVDRGCGVRFYIG
jgi:hypothetical protein